MSMDTVDITNIDVKVLTQKSELPQVNFLRSLTQLEITIQRTFKFTYIEYDLVKNEITRTERVQYNIASGINVVNVDDMKDYENL